MKEKMSKTEIWLKKQVDEILEEKEFQNLTANEKIMFLYEMIKTGQEKADQALEEYDKQKAILAKTLTKEEYFSVNRKGEKKLTKTLTKEEHNKQKAKVKLIAIDLWRKKKIVQKFKEQLKFYMSKTEEGKNMLETKQFKEFFNEQ